MALYQWNYRDHFRKLPADKIISRFGKRKWDPDITHNLSPNPLNDTQKPTFIMPSFGQHGRWGNMVFQYIFIQILAENNNAEIELNQEGEYLKSRMALYHDMAGIRALQTQPDILLLDNYQLFRRTLNYIPGVYWRAMYVAGIRKLRCFFIENMTEIIDKPICVPNNQITEVEGLFIVNPILLRQHKKFILKNLFRPNVKFTEAIKNCINKIGRHKTLIGIQIRRGDFVLDPLAQTFQYPVPVKHYIAWLNSNMTSFINPVVYVSSDDENAYKELQMAGFEVFAMQNLLPENNSMIKYEQLDWEILRQCGVLLTSNSSFGFSAALLSLCESKCYRFCIAANAFIKFEPWESEPLLHFPVTSNLWDFLYTRFNFIWKMANIRKAISRLYKDCKGWILWKLTKPICLYYVYGFSFKYFLKLFNMIEFFQNNIKHAGDVNYNTYEKIII